MSDEKKKPSIGKKILNIFDVGVTSFSFLMVFIAFMISIVSRYFIRVAVSWTYEISILGYMWAMYFGVAKCMETDSHVVFSLVYDKLGLKGKKFCYILNNALLATLLICCIYPSIKSWAASKMVTGVLKIPYKVAFFPFFYMVIMVIIRAIINIRNGMKNNVPGNENEELFDAAAEAGSEIEAKLSEGKGGNAE